MILQRGLSFFSCEKYVKIWHKSYIQKESLVPLMLNTQYATIVNFSTSKYARSRSSGKKRKNKASLVPFQVLNENNEHFKNSTEYSNKLTALINPAKHADILSSQKIGKNPAPSDAKYLKVSVVGIPNAGKSTLVNQLIGSNVCPHSAKVHTTRENALGILTKESTQIVFEVSINS